MGISGELYNLPENHPSVRHQRIVLKIKCKWEHQFSQGTILDPFFFPINVKDLHNDLKSNAKLFADDTSLFTFAQDKNAHANVLNNYPLSNL